MDSSDFSLVLEKHGNTPSDAVIFVVVKHPDRYPGTLFNPMIMIIVVLVDINKNRANMKPRPKATKYSQTRLKYNELMIYS